MSNIIRADAEGRQIVQGEEPWKMLRVGFGTASSAIDILPGARGGYTKARADLIDELVCEILTGKPSSGFAATKYMKQGIAREPFARMAYMERTGNFVEEVAFIKHDWMKVGASPDGLILPRPGISTKRGVEIKSPKETTHLRYLQMSTCPDEYFAQVQQCLWLSKYDVWDFVSFNPDFDDDMSLHIIEVPRDEAFIKKLDFEWSKVIAEVNVKVKEIKQLVASRKEAA